MISLRPIRAADVDAVRSLIARTILVTYGPFSAQVRALAAGEGVAALVGSGLDFAGGWLAVEEGAGSALGMVSTTGDLLSELFVDPTAQGRGVGRLLLHVGEREIASRGHRAGRLDVAAPNERARGFYAAHGWRETASAPHARWDFAMIAMEKALHPADRHSRG